LERVRGALEDLARKKGKVL